MYARFFKEIAGNKCIAEKITNAQTIERMVENYIEEHKAEYIQEIIAQGLMPEAAEKRLTEIRQKTIRASLKSFREESKKIDKQFQERYLVWLKTNEPGLIAFSLAGKIPSGYVASRLIQGIAKNFYVRQVDISNNPLTDKMMRCLAQSTSLISLKASNCRIRAQGAKWIARSPSITILNLSRNRIGDAGVKALATSKTLQVLNISDCGVTGTGLRHLAQSHRLLKLIFPGTTPLELINYFGAENFNAVISQVEQNRIRYFAYLIGCIVLLAKEIYDPESRSPLIKLPPELLFAILTYLDFSKLEIPTDKSRHYVTCIFNTMATLDEKNRKQLPADFFKKISRQVTELSKADETGTGKALAAKKPRLTCP